MRPEFLNKEFQDKKRYYLSNLRVNCKNCHGEGLLINEDQRTYRDCPDCVGKFEKAKNYIDANISTDYLFLGMSDVKSTYTKECYSAFEDLAKKANVIMPKYGLWFSRNNDGYSYGVTTAGTIIVKIMLKVNYECYIVNISELIDTFFNFANEDKETSIKRTQMYEFLCGVKCLMIDGFGTETAKKDSFVYNKLLTFLNSRKINNKATIICSDISKDEVFNKYDEGINKFLLMNFMNFPIKCSDGKYQRQAIVKINNEFPELSGITSYISDSTKPKPKPQEKPQQTKEPSDVADKSEYDSTLDVVEQQRSSNNGNGKNRKY